MKVPFDDMRDASELDHAHAVAAMMVKNGRGFAKSLGDRLTRMNIEGARSFKEEFPAYWNRFSKIAEVD